MIIDKVERFLYKNKEYKSLKELKEHLHNIIGEEVIDKINKSCEIRHKDLLKLLEILCDRDVRSILMDCLNIHVEIYDDCNDKTIIKNVLDI